jgi:hypothetical protein
LALEGSQAKTTATRFALEASSGAMADGVVSEQAAALRAAGFTSLDALKDVLRAEEVCRHSEATQDAYERAEAPGSKTDWLEVTSAMQERLLTEVGVPPERMAAALWLLRSAHALWPDDAEVRAISCWVRHNRARAGTLACGDRAPDLPLYPITGTDGATSVLRLCGGQPTLLVAGSYT